MYRSKWMNYIILTYGVIPGGIALGCLGSRVQFVVDFVGITLIVAGSLAAFLGIVWAAHALGSGYDERSLGN